MKCVFQIVCGENGQRSDVVLAERGQFAVKLSEALDKGQVAEGDSVLVVCVVSPTNEVEWTNAPMMRVRRFADLFSGVSKDGEVLRSAVGDGCS